MSDPVSFTSTSARYQLPFLFVGQAQKEAFVNEAHARSDALLHMAIEGETSAPPSAPADGDCWLIASGASGEWVGRSGQLACREAGNWLYVAPRDGLRVFDRSLAQERLFFATWQKSEPVEEPTGGSVVDSEARAAIDDLISALRAMGVIPPSL